MFASVSSFLSAPPGWERGPPNTRKRFCICSIMKGKEREEEEKDKHGLHRKRTAEKKVCCETKREESVGENRRKKEEKLFSCNADGWNSSIVWYHI